MSKDDLIDMQGTVVAVHSGGLYRVQTESGHEVLAPHPRGNGRGSRAKHGMTVRVGWAANTIDALGVVFRFDT